MPIYNTNKFWNYITNEPYGMILKCKDILTRKDYNFDTKTYDISYYYNNISSFTVENFRYDTIRFPAGLTKYVSEKAGIFVENLPIDPIYNYTEEQVLEYANKVKVINPKYEVRDYQIKACLTSLNNFRSLIVAGTGSGKTSIMSLLCLIMYKSKILIMNGNNFILQQIYDRLVSFGETDISWNPSEDPDYSKRIVIMNTALSDSRLNTQDQNYIKYLSTVNTVIQDEAQHFQSLTAFEPLFYMDPDKLERIVGYTASPFREYKNPYKNSDDFRLIGLLGEPAFTYDMKQSIADGNIAQPYGYFIRYQNKIPFIPEQFKDNYYMKYRASITYNKARNKACFEMIKYLYKHNIITFISLNNIKPAQKLLEELAKENVPALIICGDNKIYRTTTSPRGKIKIVEENGNTDTLKKELQNGLKIVIGTSVLDEGVDIDLFQATILCTAGKTPISALQRVGRSVRKKVNGMNVSLAIDFRDEGGLQIFKDHYLQRRELMENSGVKVLNDVHDFLELVEKIENAKEEG